MPTTKLWLSVMLIAAVAGIVITTWNLATSSRLGGAEYHSGRLKNAHTATIVATRPMTHGTQKDGSSMYCLDFTIQPPGSAVPWLREQNFEFKLDGELLNPRFEDGGLVLSTEVPRAGLIGLRFPSDKVIESANLLRITWGVRTFPDGANWEKGINRIALGVMISFGEERLSSGLPFGIHSAPYFICPFIGDKEIEGKIYTGKLSKQGGRYLCIKQDSLKQETVTELDIDNLFQTTFNKEKTPSITAIGIQINTKGTAGKAFSFIKKIELFTPDSTVE